jgi:hypothetical protein
MPWSLVRYASVLCLVVSFQSPSPASEAGDEEQLRSLHEKVLQAHRERDVELLLADESADYVVANRGEVTRPLLSERRDRLGAYLRATTFTEYRDLIEPMVTTSADGTLGWVVAQVQARGTQVDASGDQQPLAFTCAWIELYAKRGGRWYRIGNVSNFKP